MLSSVFFLLFTKPLGCDLSYSYPLLNSNQEMIHNSCNIQQTIFPQQFYYRFTLLVSIFLDYVYMECISLGIELEIY